LSQKQDEKGNVARQRETSHPSPLSGVEGRSWSGAWQEWASAVALLVLLLIVVSSVMQAEWIIPQPSLVLVLVFALVTGLLLGKSRLPGLATHTLALVLGVGVTMWQVASLQPETEMTTKFSHLIGELGVWWQAIGSGEPSKGTIQIALMFSFFTWLMGYVSMWFVIRRRNPWVAISLGALALLINLSNLSEKEYGYFLWYFLVALFLVALTTAVKHYSWFGKQPVHSARWGIKYFIPSVLCLAILTLSLSWLTPQFPVHSLETLAETNLPWWENIDGYLQNFFAAVPAQKQVTSNNVEVDLHFNDLTDLSDEVLFLVKTERPRYWWTRIYDVYTPEGWLTGPGHYEVLKQGPVGTQVEPVSPQSEVTYTVIPQVYTNTLLSTGELVSTDFSVKMKALTPLVFSLSLNSAPKDNYLPPDVDSVARKLRLELATGSISESELEQNLPEDLKLVDTHYNGEQITDIEVARTQSGPPDVVAILGSGSLMPEQRYTVTARIPTPTNIQLSQAGEVYPEWITDRYLQLPPDFATSIRRLAEDLTRTARTPYDKAVAIRDFLSHIHYSLDGNAPPPGFDGVGYFLFAAKAGNCVSFASAMAVMLRSVGVPSRLNAGYLAGEWDEECGCYVIRERDSHAWPEIYFPGYGWIAFEATPGRGLPAVAANSSMPAAEAGGADLGAFTEEYFSQEAPALAEVSPGEDVPALAEVSPGEDVPALAEVSPGEDWEAFIEEYLGGNVPVLAGSSPGEDSTAGDFLDEGMVTDSTGNVAALETPTVSPDWLVPGVVIIILILGLAAYGMFASISRLSTASTVYARMCLLASLIRLGPRPQQTALDYSAKLSAALPRQAEAIDNIAQIYVATQYSRSKTLGASQKYRLQKYWHQIRRALLLRLFRMG
jgi:transglutaminase-like putative cysteine protease